MNREGTVMATLSEPRTSEQITFAVVADPHVSTNSSGTRRMFHKTERQLKTAVQSIRDEDPSFVLVIGDLTKDGEPHNFDRFRSIVSKLSQPILAIPGNHDVTKEWDIDPEINEFDVREHFHSTYEPNSMPFKSSAGELDIIGLNSASAADGSLQQTHEGNVSSKQLEWLEEKLSQSETPIVALHHPLSGIRQQIKEHVSMIDTDLDPTLLRNDAAVTKLLIEHNVRLVFTGHLHVPGVAEVGPLREIATPATSTFPQAYLLITIGPQGTKIEYVPLTDVPGGIEAFAARVRMKGSGGLTAFSSARLASFPLLDEGLEGDGV